MLLKAADCQDKFCSAAPACTSCSHHLCQVGQKLAKTCHSCVSAICASDPYCCDTSWDDNCISAVGPECGLPKCSLQAVETSCSNGKDDDGDSWVDCGDNDCSASQSCAVATHESSCADKKDNDLDGLTDCVDKDCVCAP